jgi:hypothetical protein
MPRFGSIPISRTKLATLKQMAPLSWGSMGIAGVRMLDYTLFLLLHILDRQILLSACKQVTTVGGTWDTLERFPWKAFVITVRWTLRPLLRRIRLFMLLIFKEDRSHLGKRIRILLNLTTNNLIDERISMLLK